MKRKYNILFIHSNIGQFKTLHSYLNESKLANSWLICSQNAYKNNKDSIKNLVPFTPHGNKLANDNACFYIKNVETLNRRSIGYIKAIEKLLTKQKIDLIVCHGTAGAPLMLFDAFDIPVIPYIEFPSFKAHGWDKKYPPLIENSRRDKNFEMQSFYNVMKSSCTIVPSKYAKTLFPNELQDKIVPQMEGFPFNSNQALSTRVIDEIKTIGFCARDLSSAKGIEHFLLTSKKLLAKKPDLHFTIIGSSKLLYSYEHIFLNKKYGANTKVTFVEHLIKREKLDESKYTFTGKLAYEDYLKAIDEVDLFHYPIQFSSASWGLFELLGRGKMIIGSDRCYLPEVLEDGKNGFIVEYGKVDKWTQKTLNIINSPESWPAIKESAIETAKAYSIESIAPHFMDIFEKTIKQGK